MYALARRDAGGDGEGMACSMAKGEAWSGATAVYAGLEEVKG